MSTDANAKQEAGTHYKRLQIQPWDFIAANALGYCEGCVVKYVTRWREKGGTADLRKAIHYLEKLIELEERPDATLEHLRAVVERVRARAVEGAHVMDGAHLTPAPPADAPPPPPPWSDTP
jgi:hypothetical protein